MKDTVYRQAAIDTMCELMHHWFGGNPKDEIREIKRELGKLPPAQPSGKDPIEREAVVDILHDAMQGCGESEEDLIGGIVSQVDLLPSAQSEIIRCKDCKWKQGSECVRFAEVRPFPDDFCSRAERREK